MKKILLVILILITSKYLFAQSNIGCFQIGTSDAEISYATVITYDGNYVIAGTTESFGISPDLYIVKAEPSGGILWSKKLSSSVFDGSYDLIETSDHSLISVGGHTGNIMIVKFDENGNVQWTKDIEVMDFGEIAGIAESENNGFVVTGYTYSLSSVSRVFLVNFDSDGNKQWETVAYNQDNPFGGDASGYSVVRTVEGHYVVSGYSSGVPNYFWVASFDESGNFIWGKQSSGGPAYDIEATPDSGVIMAGYLCVTACDPVICKLDRDGNVEWTSAIGDTLYDVFYAVELTDDDGVIAAGVAKNFELLPDFRSYAFIVKFDENGDVEWKHILGDATHFFEFTDVHQTEDGGYVAGGSMAKYPQDFFIAKFDAHGNICDECLSGDYGVEVAGPEFVNITMVPENDSATVSDNNLTESTGGIATEICIETAVENIGTKISLSVFPNPVSENFQITIPPGFQAEKILISDVNGKIIYSDPVSSEARLFIDASSLPSGIYSVRLIAEKKIASAKLAVVH